MLRRPKGIPIRRSSIARTPARTRSLVIASALSAESPSARTRITTACTGAIRGGIRKPASSPCAMTSAPISLVEAPHEVCHTWRRSPVESVNVISNALAKV